MKKPKTKNQKPKTKNQKPKTKNHITLADLLQGWRDDLY
jgi:hypothetical protein